MQCILSQICALKPSQYSMSLERNTELLAKIKLYAFKKKVYLFTSESFSIPILMKLLESRAQSYSIYKLLEL